VLNEPTFEKLRALGLSAMVDALLAQQQDASIGELSFDERLGLLVDAEFHQRESKRLARLLREAKLKLPSACLEAIDATPKRGLAKAVVRQLATCQWINGAQNLAITGATGTGKTYVACALGNLACRRGHRTLYRRTSRLFHELALARADGSYVRLLAKLARVRVLIIDDWGLTAPSDVERHDLLEILEDRCGVSSTILTSQVPDQKWHDHLGDPTIADAICDRVLHNAHRIALLGPSRRKPDGDRHASESD